MSLVTGDSMFPNDLTHICIESNHKEKSFGERRHFNKYQNKDLCNSNFGSLLKLRQRSFEYFTGNAL
jgi:hypothetical protein